MVEHDRIELTEQIRRESGHTATVPPLDVSETPDSEVAEDETPTRPETARIDPTSRLSRQGDVYETSIHVVLAEALLPGTSQAGPTDGSTHEAGGRALHGTAFARLLDVISAETYGGVVSNFTGSSPVEEEPVIRGLTALLQLGRSREEIVAATLGYSDQGEPQVLVLGVQGNVEIVTPDGDVLLDVGHRDVRTIRLLPDVGVEVCLSGRAPVSFHRSRWVHRTPDHAAAELEDRWLGWTPVTHSGLQLNPLPWREEDYAYSVGRVITESAQCDIVLAQLVALSRELVDKPPGTIHAASGKELGNALHELAELPAGCKIDTAKAELGRLAQRYLAAYDERNFAVHGIRATDENGHPTDQVFKVSRPKKGQPPEVTVDVRLQDFERLAQVWYEFYDLRHEAVRALVRLTAARKTAVSRKPVADR
ncbi:hypothetical protein [Leekyejoonella antrihumi]|uniref:Uncharacterized protein n=1 Tax=Leekyejoonella antrihumi TaxID=1660198 RepID=A0A563DTP7_9MICO|nr:hypothetical protein [Leekyejoonella antrihumi]TWP33546.1 hypothetical protein FGL98_21095 [Leekyejoonella antrihumi]